MSSLNIENKKAHKNSYQIPPNASEHQRLNRQHELIQEMMFGEVFHSPIKHPIRILDVGCGTGAVTYHLGTRFPSAQIYGVDLATIPLDPKKPDNVTFVQGDYHDLLGSEEPHIIPGSMDFVFSRLLISGMTSWPSYILTCHTLLKPNGWLEIQETEFPYYDDSGIISSDWKWCQAYQAGARAKGLDLSCAIKAAAWMRESGFDDVHVIMYCWPHGEWMADRGHEEYRNLGVFLRTEQPKLYQAILPNMVSGMGYSEEEIRELQRDVLETLKVEEGKHKNYWVTFGRKPN
ncbi:hypothetical protein HO133_001959 [Letharia lupina]|uniref:S-adenosyl-L-methionine-dependent methyltransferase n=1 Tax=Letharia lupina TaxID=560253 RepID=A0A8H6FBG5_9LECA|nr:uncharacterized protein HO133_001959 [Letharia lupina]KAF6221991.1 hypothetical protein HO133_001959 [Letharia lupina]